MDALTGFWQTFDYDDLVAVFLSGKWKAIAVSPPVIGAFAVIALLVAMKRTRDAGTVFGKYAIVGSAAFVCVTALKNSDITTLGPLALGLGMFFIVSIYLVWTKLLSGL
jgi:hypothetical protein